MVNLKKRFKKEYVTYTNKKEGYKVITKKDNSVAFIRVLN